MTRHSVPLLLVTLVAVFSCSKDTTSPSMVAAVVVTPGGDTLATLGRTRQFTGVAQDASGHPLSGAALVWHSTNPAVARVDSVTGLVTAVGNGLALVRATASGVTGEAIVVVSQAVATVTITPGTAGLTTLGTTKQFSAVAKDSGGAVVGGVAFVWQSSDQAVAIVDTLGLARAQGPGQTTITAAGRGVPGNAGLTVTQTGLHFVFTSLPDTAVAGDPMSPAVEVEIQDSGGHRALGARNAVTLTLDQNPGGATLHGTLTVNAIDGVASFSGLWMDKASDGYTLDAGSAAVATGTSGGFSIIPTVAASAVIIQGPAASVEVGKALVPSIRAQAYDRFGNLASVTADTLVIEGVEGSYGGSTAGRVVAVTSAGVATWDSVVVDQPGGGMKLRARGRGFVSPNSTGITLAQILGFGPVVAAGGSSSCAMENRGVACWGANFFGQLGSGTMHPDSVPTLVHTTAGLVSVGIGQGHACGLTVTGTAYCWGAGGNGQLGDGAFASDSLPRPVSGGLAFVQLTVGTAHTCGLVAGGAAYCWGDDIYGELGDGRTSLVVGAPVSVNGGLQFSQISAGGGYTCGITTVGQAYCWGQGANGALGTNSTTGDSTPTPVASGLTFSHISAGASHTCAIAADSTAYCWGQNSQGELGDSTVAADSAPVAVVGPPRGYLFISVGNNHTCALDRTRAAYCWGSNTHGQVGNGAIGGVFVYPVAVSGGLTWDALSAGGFHNCGVSLNFARCWGYNATGQLGNASTLQLNQPVGTVTH